MVLDGFFGSYVQKLAERGKIEKIAALITTGEPDIKLEAVTTLAEYGEPAYALLAEAVDGLKIASEQNAFVREIYTILVSDPQSLVRFVLFSPERIRTLISKHIITEGYPDLVMIHNFSKSKDPTIRRAAIAVADTFGKDGFSIVLSGLFDRDREVALESASIFEKRKEIPESPREKAQYLFVREKWHELGQMGKAGRPILLRRLKEGDQTERRAVIRALGKSRDPEMINVMQRQLNDPDPIIVGESIAAISQIGGPEAERTLLACLRASYPLIRMEAGWGLQRMGYKPANLEERILLHFSREEWGALAAIGKPTIPLLIYALQEEHSAVRSGAIETLRNIGPEGINALRNVAETGAPGLALVARRAIVQIEKKNATLRAESHKKVDDKAYSSELKASLQARKAHKQSLPEPPPGTGDEPVRPPDPDLSKQRYEEELHESLRARKEFQSQVEPKTEPVSEDILDLKPEIDTSLAINQELLSSLHQALRNLYGDLGSGQELIDSTIIKPLKKKDEDIVLVESQVAADPNPEPMAPLPKVEEFTPEAVDNFPKLVASLSDRDAQIRITACFALRQYGERAVDPLIRSLRDPDLKVRAAAAESLGEIADQRAKLHLLELLKDDEPDVRVASILALSYLHDVEIIAILIEQLSDSHFRVVNAAIEALVRIGVPAQPALARALDNSSISIRTNAVVALGKMDDPDVIPVLLKYLDDPVEEMRTAVARALARIGLPSIPRLSQILNTGTRQQKLTALDALGRMSEDEATGAIRPALGDPDQSVRLYALRMLRKRESLALWRKAWAEQMGGDVPKPKGIPRLKKEDKDRYDESGGEADVKTLIQGLKDHNRNVQFASAMKLTVMGRPAIEELLNAIRHESPELQALAEEVIGEMRDVAVEPLLDALFDESPVIRAVAARNLGRIGAQKAVESLVRAMETDEDDEVRAIVVEGLGYIGTPEVIPALRRALHDREEKVRIVAARALGYINHPSAIDALISAFDDTDIRVHEAALVALNDPDGTPREHLIKALTDSVGSGSKGVSEALTSIGWIPETEEEKACLLISQNRWFEIDTIGRSAIKPMREALEKGTVEARIDAIKTMSRISGSEVIDLLIQSLNDENLMVRKRAEYALIDMGKPAIEPLSDLLFLGDGKRPIDRTIQRILRQIESRSKKAPSHDTSTDTLEAFPGDSSSDGANTAEDEGEQFFARESPPASDRDQEQDSLAPETVFPEADDAPAPSPIRDGSTPGASNDSIEDFDFFDETDMDFDINEEIDLDSIPDLSSLTTDENETSDQTRRAAHRGKRDTGAEDG